MGRYSPGTVPTSGDLDQTQRWLREEFEGVRGSTDDIYSLAEFLIDNFVSAGYGSIGRSTPLAMADIGATWQTLQWELANIVDPRGTSYDLPNGYLVTSTGIWQMNVMLNLSFAEAQAGRELQIRTFNSTDSTASNPIDYYVGRNTAGATIPIAALVTIDTTSPGLFQILADKNVQLQIRSAADTFTGVTFKQGLWDIAHQSEYKGNFLETIQSIDARRS